MSIEEPEQVATIIEQGIDVPDEDVHVVPIEVSDAVGIIDVPYGKMRGILIM